MRFLRPVTPSVFTALNAVVATAFLVGCGGAVQPLQPSSAGTAQAFPSERQSVNRGESWMSSQWRNELRNPHHKRQKLLYVGTADEGPGTVDVLDYRTGAIIGQVVLQDFDGPTGLCSDRDGNVYVADWDNQGFEIRAGTTTVTKTWDTQGRPDGCAVSKSGDVAFTNWDNGPSGGGNVEVFPGGGKTGTSYLGPGDNDMPAAYDDKGNLFTVCGDDNACSSPGLWELPAGGSSWVPLRSNRSLPFGAVEWDGKYLAVLCANGYKPRTCIDQVAVLGTRAKVVNRVPLSASSCYSADHFVLQFSTWAEDAKDPNGQTTSPTTEIVAADGWCNPAPMLVWPYPAGGAPQRAISTEPYWCDCGATIVTV